MISAADIEARMRAHRPRFSLVHILLRAGARNERVRSAFLRFVDSSGELSRPEEIAHYFEMYLGPVRQELPWFLRSALTMMQFSLFRNVAGMAMRYTIERILAPHFVIADVDELRRCQISFAKESANTVIDLLGEEVLTWSEALAYKKRYINLMRHANNASAPLHVAIKFSSLYPFFAPHNWQESKRVVSEIFGDLLREAQKTNTHITVDAESSQVCGLTEEIFLDTIMSYEFRGYPHVGIALQAYRKDAWSSATRFVSAACERGTPFTIRLIKGAYWDMEMIRAKQNGWPMPLFEYKERTDREYGRIAAYLISQRKCVRTVFGTHNPQSIAQVLYLARYFGMKEMPEIQVLYGLGEHVRQALCDLGVPVRAYMPVGDLRQGMAYFARRILENTANNSVLLQFLG